MRDISAFGDAVVTAIRGGEPDSLFGYITTLRVAGCWALRGRDLGAQELGADFSSDVRTGDAARACPAELGLEVDSKREDNRTSSAPSVARRLARLDALQPPQVIATASTGNRRRHCLGRLLLSLEAPSRPGVRERVEAAIATRSARRSTRSDATSTRRRRLRSPTQSPSARPTSKTVRARSTTATDRSRRDPERRPKHRQPWSSPPETGASAGSA